MKRFIVKGSKNLLIGLSVLLSMMRTSDAADAEISWQTLPSSWMPSSVVSLTTNANSTSGWDVAYWFNFAGHTNSMNSPYWTDSDKQGTLEIGWKDTGHRNCNLPRAVTKIGWPSDVEVQPDWTEDLTDAVVWIADLPKLRGDQLSKRSHEYFIMWDCQTHEGYWEADRDKYLAVSERPVLEAQLGSWRYRVKSPATTYSRRTQTIIPAEQGHKGVPRKSDTTGSIQTNAYLPWATNWDFESGVAPWSMPTTGTIDRICSDGPIGSCYVYLNPRIAGSNSTIMRQAFKVPSVTSNGQIFSGANTSYTVVSRFRCPSWSPSAYKGGGSACQVRVGLRPINSSTVEWKTVSIPNNNTWYYKQSPVHWSWGAHSNDDDVEILIDSMGYGIDVDGVWVSSGT